MANDKQKRADALKKAQQDKPKGKYSDRILYSPLDNPKTYEKVTRPGLVPKRA